MTEENARKTLSDLGLICSKVTEVYSDTVAAGLVCEQSVSVDAIVKAGDNVEIKLSKGQEKKYYDCSIEVSQPPKYQGGNANVRLLAPDGTELFNTTVDSFPTPINLSRIYGVSKGKVVVTYIITFDEEYTDENGNPATRPATAEDRYEYEVDFKESNG